MENDAQNLKERHKMGLKGILYIQNWKIIVKKIPFRATVIATFLTTILFTISKKSSYEILDYLIQMGLSVLPNLLGFSLGGYALIVGFGNTSLIKRMTRKLNKENASLFQKLSAIFAFGLLLQIASLSGAFFVGMIYKLDISLWQFSPFRNKLYSVLNFIACTLLIFIYYWTFFILPFIVTNIFSFGQTHHFYLTVEKITEDRQSNSEERNDG